VDFLRGEHQAPRLRQVTRLLCAEALQIGHLAADEAAALVRIDAVLADGSALQHFARMVTVLGGPADFCERAAHYLPAAPTIEPVPAPRAGWVQRKATRDIGLLVVELGGGRRRASDRIDHRVGFSRLVSIGQRVERGQPLGFVHAADGSAAPQAAEGLARFVEIGDSPMAAQPVLIERVLS
jgi:thymidine phosphorylase